MSTPTESSDRVLEEAVHQIAARLANTKEVLQAWSSAMRGQGGEFQERILQAARELERAVAALDGEDLEARAVVDVAETFDDTFALAGEEIVSADSGGDFGLRGRSEMISLVEMVGFLSSLGRNGVLQAQSENQDYIIELTGGFLTYATVSPKRAGISLREILLERGALDEEALAQGIANADDSEFLGEALRRQELVKPKALEAALAEQAVKVFGCMHEVGTGFDFQFEEAAEILETKDIRLGVSGLLLESARIVDEGNRDAAHWECVLQDPLDEALPDEAPEQKPPAPVPVEAGDPEVEAELEAALEEPLLDLDGDDLLDAIDAAAAPPGRGDGGETEVASREDEEIQLDPPWAPEGGVTEGGELDDLEAFRTSLDRLLQADELEVPVLPEGTGQLLALCWADEYDPEELMDCVNRDQTLCAHVLRVANSAAYAPATSISSIRVAIARIGLDKLRETAMALTLRQKVFRLDGWEHLIKSLWRRAALTSGFGGAVGRECGAGSVRGSLVGLLRDVGRPIVVNALCDIRRDRGLELTHAVAKQLMDEFHGRLGAQLARKWQLPEWLAGSMLHDADYAEAGEHRTEAMIGHLAGCMARWSTRADEDEAQALIGLEVCSELGLRPKQVERILAEGERIREMAKIYA